MRISNFLIISFLEHIFDKYPVSFGGVVDEDMGNGTDDLVVLDNG